MAKIVFKGFVLVPPSELDVVNKELSTHIELTRKENGCLVFEVTQDRDNPCKFHVYEEFSNQKAFETHQARVKVSRWGLVTTNVERNYKISSE